MRTKCTSLLLLLAFLLFGSFGFTMARSLAIEERPVADESVRTPLYLPQVRYTKLISLGYDSTLSRVIWFSTINYFGFQVVRKNDLRWLAQMCELTVGLDPHPEDPIEFCGAILGWMVKDPFAAERVLTTGIKYHPDYWRFYYMRGFVRWYFLERMELAQQDMLAASHTPDAPQFVQGIASQMLVSTQNAHIARQFLGEMLKGAKDPAAKKALDEKYRQAILSEALEDLQGAVKEFTRRNGRAPAEIEDLVKSGIISAVPLEPFGGKYSLDPKTGEPKTDSGAKSLSWTGKTAKTGVFAEEFKNLKFE